VRQVNLTLSLEFLAPQLVKATIEERIPRGINIERLRDPDSDRSRQFQDLGINPKLHQSFSVNFLRSSAAMVPARKFGNNAFQ
jgi:hypothetical protein